MILYGDKTKKVVCKNVTRNIHTGRKSRRVCMKKYKKMQNVKHHLYWR